MVFLVYSLAIMSHHCNRNVSKMLFTILESYIRGFIYYLQEFTPILPYKTETADEVTNGFIYNVYKKKLLCTRCA